MLRRTLLILLTFALIASLSMAQTKTVAPKTPAKSDPAAFMKQAEQRLEDVSVKASRVSWVQETYITDDTEAIAADANNEVLATVTDLVTKAKPFERAQLDPVLKRKF